MGVPLDALSTQVDIVAELHRLSEGDPLLVRLYVDDLWKKGAAATRLQPEDLHALQPGLHGYFDRWWEDQRKQWDGTLHSGSQPCRRCSTCWPPRWRPWGRTTCCT